MEIFKYIVTHEKVNFKHEEKGQSSNAPLNSDTENKKQYEAQNF